MPKRNPAADLLERLDKFVEQDGQLPRLPDGKINVTGLCKLLEARPSDAQYFHKSDELKGAVNALCEEQGLLKIGHRAQSEEDASTNERLNRVQKQSTHNARAAAEQSAASESLLHELQSTRRELEDVKLERDSLAERLAIIDSGGVPPRF